MSRVIRKAVFGVSDHGRHKPGCIQLQKLDCTTCICSKNKGADQPDRTVQLTWDFVFSYAKSRFSHDVAQMIVCRNSFL